MQNLDNNQLSNDWICGEHKPKLCLEVNPPRGTDFSTALEKISPSLDKIDFLNVTDCALAKMKAAALPFGALLKRETGKEVVVNLACRDRNLIALQADLLAAWMMGVKGIVALTGDAVSVGDSPDCKGVFEVNSVGLLQAISSLNKGQDIIGHELKGHPSFISGCVCNPNAKNTEVEVRRLTKKCLAGAVFSLSQPVFDISLGSKFFGLAKSINAKLYCGLMPIKNKKALQHIKAVPGIKLSPEFIDQVESLPEAQIPDFSIAYALELANSLKDDIAGFHIISGGYPSLANELIQELHLKLKH
jgi:5,10-methylenetetrahydrofolate reductase